MTPNLIPSSRLNTRLFGPFTSGVSNSCLEGRCGSWILFHPDQNTPLQSVCELKSQQGYTVPHRSTGGFPFGTRHCQVIARVGEIERGRQTNKQTKSHLQHEFTILSTDEDHLAWQAVARARAAHQKPRGNTHFQLHLRGILKNNDKAP